MTSQPHRIISIIMPAYNAGSTILAAIRSVLAQTYPHWELIIIDDCSDDDTEMRVASFSEPRIIYRKLAQKLGYPSKVRNKGLSLAKGSLIAFLDSDDELYPDTLLHLENALLENPSWLIAQGYEALMSADGSAVRPSPSLIRSSSSDSGYQFSPAHRPASLKAFLLCQNPCLLSTALFRKECFEKLEGFDDAYYSGEDQEFFLRLYLDSLASKRNAPFIGMLPVLTYRYRQQAHSLVHRIENRERAISDNIKLLDWFFSHDRLLPEDIRQLKSRVYANRYGYAANSLLLDGYPKEAVRWSVVARNNPNILVLDWLKTLLPVLLKSHLPVTCSHLFNKFKYDLKQLAYNLRHQFKLTLVKE